MVAGTRHSFIQYIVVSGIAEVDWTAHTTPVND